MRNRSAFAVVFCVFLASLRTFRSSASKYAGTDGFRDESSIVQGSLPEKEKVILYEPMIFGVAQGTTGTHGMYEATCNLNLTSAHYFLLCVEQDKGNPSDQLVLSAQAHFKAIEAYIRLEVCVREEAFQLRSCPMHKVLKIMREMRRSINQVIRGGTIHAVHDTPYTLMTSHVRKLIKQSRPNLDPVLLLSERDSLEWALKRAADHPTNVLGVVNLASRRVFFFFT